ncbi:uncharacterized protein LOC133556905 [Nerophis ophidion]|uniref:uncharacterized protein LOC133556905 n=1 Tax=Nerophis ophidion TaxID=159077 RepID=UPI002ADF3D05|nr:uncharacterized protein LOC133556905 [Nerophis ophidion]
MGSVHYLRQFVNERLIAAADEIFGVFERTIVEYQEKLDRQRQLVDVLLKPQIKVCRIERQHEEDEEDLIEQRLYKQNNFSLDQEDVISREYAAATVPAELQHEEDEEDLREQRLYKQENFSLDQEDDVNSREYTAATELQHEDDEDDLTEQRLYKQENFSRDQEDDVISREYTAATELQDVDQQQLCWQERNSLLDQEKPETPQIKEEPWSSHEEEAFRDTLLSLSISGENYKTEELNESRSEDQSDCFAALDASDDKVEGDTNSKVFKCDYCGKAFSFSCKLKRHMLSHTGVKPYSCKTCGKTFSQRSNLKRHSMIHTDEKPYSCKMCGKQFRNAHEVSTHVRTHTGEKPYPCDTCGRSFIQLSILKRHAMVHTGEKPFLCNTCGRGFSHPSVLKRHAMVHTGEKPYICNICGTRFRASSTLAKHRRVHLGEKPHRFPSQDNYVGGNQLRLTLEEVLQQNEDVFKEWLGTWTGPPAKIYINNGVVPKFYKPRLVPFAMRKKVEAELERLTEQGVIEPVKFAEWAAPIVPVLKPDNSVRICGDYKLTVNLASKLEQYPFPRMEDLFEKLAGGQSFAIRGILQSSDLPVAVFLDDILLTGKSDREHLETLSEVLRRLREAGLRLKRKKCAFLESEAEFLGHIVNASGLHPLPNKKLLHKDIKWQWEEEQERAFEKSKELMQSSREYVIVYKPGKHHSNADALSRLPMPKETTHKDEGRVLMMEEATLVSTKEFDLVLSRRIYTSNENTNISRNTKAEVQQTIAARLAAKCQQSRSAFRWSPPMSAAHAAMSKFHHLRTFVNERLTAAAEEIFGVFEKTMVAYEAEMDRRLKLLEVACKPAHRAGKPRRSKESRSCLFDSCCRRNDTNSAHVYESPQPSLGPQESISSVEQELQEPTHIKVEQEELLDEEHLLPKQELYFSNREALGAWPLVLDCEQNESEAEKDATAPRLRSESENGDFDASGLNGDHPMLFQDYYPENNQGYITDNMASTSGRSIKLECHDQDLENTDIHCQGQLFEQPFHCGTFHADSHLYAQVDMRALCTDKPFICNICGKGFGFKRYLAQHMITHSAEKPYVCSRCRKTFRRQQALKIHMRCHTGEKPYFCKTCGKRFCQSSALRVHLRVHTGEKPYPCKMCGIGFRSLPVLRNHIRRSHDGKML